MLTDDTANKKLAGLPAILVVLDMVHSSGRHDLAAGLIDEIYQMPHVTSTMSLCGSDGHKQSPTRRTILDKHRDLDQI